MFKQAKRTSTSHSCRVTLINTSYPAQCGQALVFDKKVGKIKKVYLYTSLEGWSYHMGHLMGKKGRMGMPCAELASNVAQQAGFAIKGLCILHEMTVYANPALVDKHAIQSSVGVSVTSCLEVSE